MKKGQTQMKKNPLTLMYMYDFNDPSDSFCRADRLHVRIANHKSNQSYMKKKTFCPQRTVTVTRTVKVKPIEDSIPSNPVLSQFGVEHETLEQKYMRKKREKK